MKYNKKEGKQDHTCEGKNNLGRNMSGEEVWGERSEFGEVRSQNQSREIEKMKEKSC